MAEGVALLSRINVGGENLISMQALAECFRAATYEGARAHIQSGNVLFPSVSPGGADLEATLERMLRQRFDTPIPEIVRSGHELAPMMADVDNIEEGHKGTHGGPSDPHKGCAAAQPIS